MVWLILLSALLHASWNGVLRRDPDPLGASAVVLAAAAVAACVLALVSSAPLPTRAAHWSLIAGVFDGLYFVALAAALARAPLATAYTISRGGAIFVVWPLSIVWLGEPLQPLHMMGSVVLVAGL